MRYLIIVEETPTGYSAYSPDVAGCVAAGSTRAEVEELIRGALAGHIEILREDEHDVPRPTSYATYVEVAA